MEFLVKYVSYIADATTNLKRIKEDLGPLFCIMNKHV